MIVNREGLIYPQKCKSQNLSTLWVKKIYDNFKSIVCLKLSSCRYYFMFNLTGMNTESTDSSSAEGNKTLPQFLPWYSPQPQNTHNDFYDTHSKNKSYIKMLLKKVNYK